MKVVNNKGRETPTEQKVLLAGPALQLKCIYGNSRPIFSIEVNNYLQDTI